MAPNRYVVGQMVRFTATFSLNGTPTNTTVAVSVKNPNGTVTAPTATSGGTGVYYVDQVLDVKGRWAVRFAGSGAVVAAVEGQVNAETEF